MCQCHVCVNKCNCNHEKIKCYSKIYEGCELKRNIGRANPLTRRRRLLSRKLLLTKLKIHKKSINSGNCCCYPILKSSFLQNFASCCLNRVYKTVNHRLKHNEFILSRDIEKNPGPYPYTVIDPNKTMCSIFSR